MDVNDNFFIPDMCIYHGNCADGFGAAYAVWKRFGRTVEYIPGVYGMTPPDVAGKAVLLVDFSFKREVIVEMLKTAAAIFIIDHHKTAIEDLTPLLIDDNLYVLDAVFDTDKSGAMLTWEHYHGGEVPALIRHIQDRDLWQFKLVGTREIQANLFSYPYDFEVWDRLMHMPTETLISDGMAIERKHFKDIDELLGVTQRRMVIGGYDVPVANLPYTFSSDAGHKMGKGEPFAACYYDTPEGRCFSLRSTDDGQDVSAVAKCYGGGGHRNAAGFTMPRNWEGDDDDNAS